MKTILSFCLILCVTITSAQSHEISTSNSTFSWTGKAAFSSYSLTGKIKVKNGNVVIEGNQIHKFNITMDMKTLNHENSDLEYHLRSKDFFEVNTYTEAKFELTETTRIVNNRALLKGKLTIKDVTKTETFLIYVNQGQSEITFNITIDRTVYGVKFNSPSFFKKLKENAIADEFIIKGKILLK
ncbi:YceI family protein [Winogradskyella alexanderae]|uniref:YceI family protein n=1 Tax=Winogradskyella alexanderae TaxID=2877123 RepID=A0ABS7XS00_9FLAO|nr:YceI family protein [Winogradskyella alexanderae]MCA0132540.1 YceI family protein [Winogradskyella alexanderae]